MPPLSLSDGPLDQELRTRLTHDAEVLDKLRGADLRPGEWKNLAMIERAGDGGLEAACRRLGPERRAEVEDLVRQFVRLGPRALLLSGSERGGDFLNNQLRGQWAERVVLSMALGELTLCQFGPSSAAMPGDQDHDDVVRTFRLVVLLEGKRPDLLAFDTSVWESLDGDVRAKVLSWPARTLEASDRDLVCRATAAIEVKSSTWHYETRRRVTDKPLSVTVKDEELDETRSWMRATGVPLLFVQVLFDEIYCMSFLRMLDALKRGYLYDEGDYEAVVERESGGKTVHHFYLKDQRHLCGLVVFPSESEARVTVLTSGSVVPHIRFHPAQTRQVNPDVFLSELRYPK